MQDVFPDVAVELGKLTEPAARRRGQVAGARRPTAGPPRSPSCPRTSGPTSRPRSGPPTAPPFGSSPTSSTPTLIRPWTGRTAYRRRARDRRRPDRGHVRRQRRLLAVARASGRRRPAGWPTARPGLRRQRWRVRPGRLRRRRPRTCPTCGSRPTNPRIAWPRCWPLATSTWCRLQGVWPRRACPSKTYSILAAGRPVLASIDAGTEVASVIETGRLRASPCRPTTPTPSPAPSRSSWRDPAELVAMGGAGPGLGRALGIPGRGGRGLRGARSRRSGGSEGLRPPSASPPAPASLSSSWVKHRRPRRRLGSPRPRADERSAPSRVSSSQWPSPPSSPSAWPWSSTAGRRTIRTSAHPPSTRRQLRATTGTRPTASTSATSTCPT